ncbi:MAG: hypothetical protein ACERKD_24290 [Prolixibacteraceae bacterium]
MAFADQFNLNVDEDWQATIGHTYTEFRDVYTTYMCEIADEFILSVDLSTNCPYSLYPKIEATLNLNYYGSQNGYATTARESHGSSNPIVDDVELVNNLQCVQTVTLLVQMWIKPGYSGYADCSVTW